MHDPSLPAQTSASSTLWGAYLLGGIELFFAATILFSAGLIFAMQLERAELDSLFVASTFTLTGLFMALAAIRLLAHRKFSAAKILRARWYAIVGQVLAGAAGVVEIVFGGHTGNEFARGSSELAGLVIVGFSLLLLLFSLTAFLYSRRLARA